MPFIRLTLAEEAHSTGMQTSNEVTVNSRHIIQVRDSEGKEIGSSRIFLENGKSLYVEESQDDIREQANSGGGGGIRGMM